MARWSDVSRVALALPDVVEDGRCWRVRAKLIAWERPLRAGDIAALGDAAPSGPILGVRTVDLGEKAGLLAADPTVYFTTPHFDGYPSVLVRLPAIGVRDLRELITEAWLARAPKRLAAAFLTAGR